MSSADGYIAVGEIITGHGRAGEVRVLPLTDFPERLGLLDEVQVKVGDVFFTYHVYGVRPFRRGFIMRFREINDPETAAGLRGGLIRIPRAAAMPLPEGRYYVCDLVGLPVYTVDGTYVGELQDVWSRPANDVFVVRDVRHGGEILLPAIRSVFTEIDLQRKKICIDPLPGLLE